MDHSSVPLVPERLAKAKVQVRQTLVSIHELAKSLDLSDARHIASEVLSSLDEPFTLLILGEVKAGKSSLINALLGAEVCTVAPDPCTDKVTLITAKGSSASLAHVPDVRVIEADGRLFADLAVVDTPGIDSIIERHQAITEAFLPRGDLVLFALPAINPYSGASWKFVDEVAMGWGKPMIFVLTMMDLASPQQRRINMAKVVELAGERSLRLADILAVSTIPAPSGGPGEGIENLRQAVAAALSGDKAQGGKVQAALGAARRALVLIEHCLSVTTASLHTEQERTQLVRQRLEDGRMACERAIEHAMERLEAGFAATANEWLLKLEDELAFGSMMGRSLRGIFKRASDQSSWAKTLTDSFQQMLTARLDPICAENAKDLAHALEYHVGLATQALVERGGIAAPDTSDPRRKTIHMTLARIDALLQSEVGDGLLSAQRLRSLDPKATFGGAMTVLGLVFAVSVKAAALDVAGGIVSGLGAVLASATLFWSRPRLIRQARKKLMETSAGMAVEVRARLEEESSKALEAVMKPFEGYFVELSQDEQIIKARQEEFGRIEKELTRIGLELGALTAS